MAIKRGSNLTKNKLAFIVGEVFYTEQEIVAQSNIKKIGETLEMLVVEANNRSMRNTYPHNRPA